MLTIFSLSILKMLFHCLIDCFSLSFSILIKQTDDQILTQKTWVLNLGPNISQLCDLKLIQYCISILPLLKKKTKPKPCKMESKLYRFIKGLNNIMIVDICLAYSSNTETTLFCLSWHYSVPLNFIYSLYIQRGSVLRYREQNSGYQWGEGREKA